VKLPAKDDFTLQPSYLPNPLVVGQKMSIHVQIQNMTKDLLPGETVTLACEPLTGVTCPKFDAMTWKTGYIGAYPGGNNANFNTSEGLKDGRYRFTVSMPNLDGSLAKTQFEVTAGGLGLNLGGSGSNQNGKDAPAARQRVDVRSRDSGN
jgi:hypothetical protein